jgi:hypothetical protein
MRRRSCVSTRNAHRIWNRIVGTVRSRRTRCKKRLPRLGRWSSAADHVLAHARFTNVDPEFQPLAMGSSEHPRAGFDDSLCGSGREPHSAPSDDPACRVESSSSRTGESVGDSIPRRLRLARCACRTASFARPNRATPRAGGPHWSALGFDRSPKDADLMAKR